MKEGYNEDVTKTSNKNVSCDGGGPLGHPLIYLEIGQNHEVICPYCGHKFLYVEKK